MLGCKLGNLQLQELKERKKRKNTIKKEKTIKKFIFVVTATINIDND